jgi:hypothetical protein
VPEGTWIDKAGRNGCDFFDMCRYHLANSKTWTAKSRIDNIIVVETGLSDSQATGKRDGSAYPEIMEWCTVRWMQIGCELNKLGKIDTEMVPVETSFLACIKNVVYNLIFMGADPF